MKKRIGILILALAVLLLCSSFVGAGELPVRKGWIHYVDIRVNWNGQPGDQGDWYVYAVNVEGYDEGDLITSCDTCLDMEYDFEFRGNTLSFDETYVAGVEAHPQTHHVVLHDHDGDGTYTGKDTARYEFPDRPGQIYLDVLVYTVETDGNENVIDFEYVEHEYYKNIEE